jgi:hypothetical protein
MIDDAAAADDDDNDDDYDEIHYIGVYYIYIYIPLGVHRYCIAVHCSHQSICRRGGYTYNKDNTIACHNSPMSTHVYCLYFFDHKLLQPLEMSTNIDPPRAIVHTDT